MVLQVLQSTDGEIDAADVVLTVVAVKADEGAIEDLAEPVPELRLDEPVTHLEGLLILPEVATAVEVKGYLRTHSEFEGSIGRAHDSPVEGVGLKCYFLSLRTLDGEPESRRIRSILA